MADYTSASNNNLRYSDAPEVVPGEFQVAQKIPAPDYTPPEVNLGAPGYHDGGIYDGSAHIQPGPLQTRRLWHRKRVWLIAFAVLLALVGLIVGLVVGLRRDSDSDSDSYSDYDNDEQIDEASARDEITFCDDDKFCRQTLHTAQFDGTLYLFARSDTDRIMVKSYDGNGWDEDWKPLSPEGETIVSPPAAMGWRKDVTIAPELGLFAVKEDDTLYRTGLINGTWVDWVPLSSNVGSQLVLCTIETRMHIWGVDTTARRVAHNYWAREMNLNNADWSKWREDSFQAKAETGIGVVCRENASLQHDVAWYEEENGQIVAKHQQWGAGGGWQGEAQTYRGHFVGDPFLFYHTDNKNKVYFLGSQRDSQMYYYSWEDSDYSDLQSLGGSIASTPTVVTVDDGSTTDMFALSTNKTLQHLSYNGTGWTDEWRDLGIEGRSAPTAEFFNDQVLVFMVHSNGSAILLTFSLRGDEIDFEKKPVETNLGGKLSSKGYYQQ